MTTTCAPSRDALLLQRAAVQHTVLSTGQLNRIGVSGGGIGRRRRRGVLHPMLPATWTVAGPASGASRNAWKMSATLAGRAPRAIGHETAAEQLGIWNRAPDGGTIRVVGTGRAIVVLVGSPAVSEIVIHRSSTLEVMDVVHVDGIPTTTALRTIVDAAARFEVFQVTAMIREAVYRGLLDTDDLDRHLAHAPACRSTRITGEALGWFRRGSAGTRSWSEDEYLRLVAAAGLPMPAVNVRGITGAPAVEPDFVWEHPRAIVELDGGHHQLPGMPESDADTDAMHASRGWPVARITSRDVWTRPRHVVATTARLLGRD